MKKILLFLLFSVISFTSFAQEDLKFSKVLFISLSSDGSEDFIAILVSKRTEYKIRRYKTLNLYSNGKEETQISQLQDKCRNGAVTRRIN